jgi:Protein of unknown function DUF262
MQASGDHLAVRTTATNRKLRDLLTDIRDQKLIPRPEFQRRLVWATRHKNALVRTVLDGYPFPEIYTAVGEVDLDTGEGKTLLVDGQQRLTTLYQYFVESEELRLAKDILSYKLLGAAEKSNFLEYDVVVRDLGQIGIDQIKIVFEKINSTQYSLNAMEIHNARYDGEFKKSAEELSQVEFFNRKRIFSANEIRRMGDTLFMLRIMVTVMSTYFNRDDEIESYLEKYNDEFPEADELGNGLGRVLSFIDQCDFDDKSRVWKLADLFSLIVELYWSLVRDKRELVAKRAKDALDEFYDLVEQHVEGLAEALIINGADGSKRNTVELASKYARAAIQASNDRGNRVIRGSIIREVISRATK